MRWYHGSRWPRVASAHPHRSRARSGFAHCWSHLSTSGAVSFLGAHPNRSRTRCWLAKGVSARVKVQKARVRASCCCLRGLERPRSAAVAVATPSSAATRKTTSPKLATFSGAGHTTLSKASTAMHSRGTTPSKGVTLPSQHCTGAHLDLHGTDCAPTMETSVASR